MSEEKIDQGRRKFLVGTTAAVGTIGVVAAAIPLASAMFPNAQSKAAGAPVKVNISDLKPGEQKTVMWRGRPVWIIRRTPEMLNTLEAITPKLRDPNSLVDQQPPYAKNEYRSIKPEFLILVGICTHLGCSPTYRPDKKSIDQRWLGGFYCACHGSKFDLAGRVFKGVPAPINMEVPPYVFLNDNEILIGSSKAENVA